MASSDSGESDASSTKSALPLPPGLQQPVHIKLKSNIPLPLQAQVLPLILHPDHRSTVVEVSGGLQG